MKIDLKGKDVNDHPTRCKLNHICYATACAAGTIQVNNAWTPESVMYLASARKILDEIVQIKLQLSTSYFLFKRVFPFLFYASLEMTNDFLQQ